MKSSSSRTLRRSLLALLLPSVLAWAPACGKEDGPAAAEGSAGTASAEAPADGRLEPGLGRLHTGVDLSKVDTGVEPASDHPGETPAGGVAADGGTAGQAPEDLATGHLTLEGEDSHDFGQIIQGTHASHVFRMVSDGEEALIISRIKPSCGCTVANVATVGEDGSRTPYTVGERIPPGTKVEIEAEFKSDNKQGHTRTQVAVYCNDPRTVISLQLEAEVEPVLVLEPRTLNLGMVTSADQVEGTMTVTSTTLPPYMLEVDQQFVQPNMEVEIEPVDPDAEGRSREWNVHLTLGPQLPEGMRNYPVRLITDQEIPDARDADKGAPQKYLVIGYAQVQVQGIVSAEPGYVPFGMVRPGQVVERFVRIVCHDDFQLSADVPVSLGALIQSDAFDYDEVITTELTPVEGENALDLKVRLEGLPDGVQGSFGGMLRVKVGHPDKEELVVRFSGVCRPGMPSTEPDAPQTPAGTGSAGSSPDSSPGSSQGQAGGGGR